MKSVDMSALRDACAHFYEVLHLATVSQDNGDRVVDTPVLAQVLSRATNDLSRAMARAINELFRAYALVQSCNSDGSISWHPASEDPWEALPSSGLKIMTLDLGPSGTPPLLWTALNYAIKVVAFPPDLQHRMVGGDGMSTRWRDGDVICRQDIERIDHVAGLIGLAEKAATVPPSPALSNPPPLPATPEFYQIGQHWWISYAGVSGSFPNWIGFKYLWKLLHHPHPQRDMTAADLRGGPVVEDARSDIPDDERDYLRTLLETKAELQEDLGLANSQLNESAALRITADIEEIEREIRARFNHRGLARQLGQCDGQSKAANSIDRAIDRVCHALRQADPPLSEGADHIETSIKRSKAAFGYRPSGLTPSWKLDRNLGT